MAKKKAKPSQVLLRAAEMVDAYNNQIEPYTYQWEFGCHALQLAAQEMSVIPEQFCLCETGTLGELIPEIYEYFELTRLPNSKNGVWFHQPAYLAAEFPPELMTGYGEHRVMALLMAAAIAESERK